MGLHKGFDKVESRERSPNPSSEWRFRWPNTADFNFNYYKLLADNEVNGIGHARVLADNEVNGIGQTREDAIKIAIIGAGIAGLTAARELFRCGYTHIDIYEASDRIGGRTYSQRIADNRRKPVEGKYTVFEMGAMRMPFFCSNNPKDPNFNPVDTKNSVLDYYRKLFDIKTQDFPNPGSQVADTGIYLNNGYGPDTKKPYNQPQLDIWTKGGQPPNPLFQEISKKWSDFASMVTGVCQTIYGQDSWQEFWQNFVQYYWEKNFRELVRLPKIEKYDPSKAGWFGGLGMSEEESNLFYTIGAGDGGWGAFYDISCLYPIRTLLFGFGNKHQLIQGKFNDKGEFQPGHFYGEEILTDSRDNKLESPSYLGVQTFAECLFYEPVKSAFPSINNVSLYQASKRGSGNTINLFTGVKAELIERKEDGSIEISYTDSKTGRLTKNDYSIVILTPTTWAWQMGISFKGFDQTQLPFSVTYSMKESHWITSCKVFYPLKERYWENSSIPQVIATDTYLQGIYGYATETKAIKTDPGVLIVSYTWEDDANKFIAENDDAAFAKKCLDELDKILLECKNINTRISQYVDTSQPVVIHWAKMPTYRGCAKLYREMTWNEDYQLLKYNQNYSSNSGLYFAGEAFSVEGGWTEPALRSALDAVIHIIPRTGGYLNFDVSKYPNYTDWSPNKESIATATTVWTFQKLAVIICVVTLVLIALANAML